LPISPSADYLQVEKIPKLFISIGYLSRLKDFLNGDNSKIITDLIIDKETIVHRVLSVDRYSVTPVFVLAFDSDFEAAVNVTNTLNASRISVDLEQAERR
jgi:hypothetical protein